MLQGQFQRNATDWTPDWTSTGKSLISKIIAQTACRWKGGPKRAGSGTASPRRAYCRALRSRMPCWCVTVAAGYPGTRALLVPKLCGLAMLMMQHCGRCAFHLRLERASRVPVTVAGYHDTKQRADPAACTVRPPQAPRGNPLQFDDN